MAWLLHLEQVLQAPDALTGYLLLGVPRSKYLLSIWCNGKRTRTVTGNAALQAQRLLTDNRRA